MIRPNEPLKLNYKIHHQPIGVDSATFIFLRRPENEEPQHGALIRNLSTTEMTALQWADVFQSIANGIREMVKDEAAHRHRQWAIIGADGIVHYRRPEGHKDLEEARSVPGYKVVPVDSPEHEAAMALQAKQAAER